MRILHFADLHLGVENYGRIDPATGLSSRLNDFLSALDKVMDYAIESRVDLVLFCGDAYKTREPTQTQQREFAKRISRLSGSGIPILLVVGNHDLPNALGRATTTEIFDTLAVKNVYVADHPDVFNVPTAGGKIQVVALPWLRRSALLSREDIRNLDFEQINQRMQQVLTNTINSCVERLDASLPAVLAAHVLVGDARVKAGSESLMSIGQEHALLLSSVALPAFDYVALGHIHRHQVLSENPPVVYAGSLERVDFGEEKDEKGFCVAEIATDQAGGRRRVSFEFHPVKGRRFLTIGVTLQPENVDPTASVLMAINEQRDKIGDAVVRLNINLPAGAEGQLRDSDIRDALKEAHYFTVSREIQRETLIRLGNRTAEGITPLEALKLYLESKNISTEKAQSLLEHGAKLIQGGNG